MATPEDNPKKIEQKFNIIVDLECVKRYHPIFEIEYQNCVLQGLPYFLKQEIALYPDVKDESQLEDYYKILADVYSLDESHVCNMFGIIKTYIDGQSPSYVREMSFLTKRFYDIVYYLFCLDQLNDKSGLRILIDLKRQFGKSNGFEVNETEELSNLSNVLKDYFITELHKLKSSFQAFTHENTIDPIENYIDIAILVAQKKRINRNYEVSIKHLYKMLSLVKVKHYDYKSEFLRMIYKTLMEYLNNETLRYSDDLANEFQNKPNAKKYRIIYQLSYAFGLLPRIESKTEQKDRVKNILKNFTIDNRPQLKRKR